MLTARPCKTILSYWDGSFSGAFAVKLREGSESLPSIFFCFSATWKAPWGFLLTDFCRRHMFLEGVQRTNNKGIPGFLVKVLIFGMSHGVSLVPVNDSNHQ